MARDPEDKILRKIMATGKSKSQAVAIAKSQGLVKQSGGSLSLTEKGRKATRRKDGK